MTKKSEYLVAYGFTKEGFKGFKLGDKLLKLEGKTPGDKLNWIRAKRKEFQQEGKGVDKTFDQALEDAADHNWQEQAQNQLVMEDQPKHLGNTYMVSIENWHQSIEQYYYWCMNFFSDVGFVIIDKITDTFAAAEHSSFFGGAGQRLGLAQDKVGQYLATIGKMVKDLFSLVRELRWIDERLTIYRDAFGEDKDGNKVDKDGKSIKKGDKTTTPRGALTGAEIALKGMWVDLVDGVVGGQRTGSNLFNMATQLQFVALPDLFFSIHPQETKDISKIVKDQAGSVNEQVRNVLERKLEQYLAWKKSTYDEMVNRRKFTIDYLRQHYNSIKLYMTWIKPYIKHIQKLTGQIDLLDNARLVSSFESNLIEIEVIARAMPRGNKKVFQCVMVTFEYHSKPQMQFSADPGYHRGPLHIGACKITWRPYAWTEEQIQNYKDMRNQQDIDLIASIDKNLQTALDQLGGDIFNYIKEAEAGGKEQAEKKNEEPQKMDLLEPFSALVSGVKDAFGALIPTLPKGKSGGSPNLDGEYRSAIGGAKGMTFLHYNIFKKAHGLLSW